MIHEMYTIYALRITLITTEPPDLILQINYLDTLDQLVSASNLLLGTYNKAYLGAI